MSPCSTGSSMSPDRLPACSFGYGAAEPSVRWPWRLLRSFAVGPGSLVLYCGCSQSRVMLPLVFRCRPAPPGHHNGALRSSSGPSVSSPNRRPWLLPKHRDGVWRLPHAPLRRCVPPRLWMRIRWASVRYTADGTNTRSWVALPPRSAADRASVASEDSRQGAQQRKPLHPGTGIRPG